MLQAKVVYLKHSQLIPNPKNRTVKRSEANTKARAATIKALGAIIQNIVVTPVKGKKDLYQIEAGEGRYESVSLLIAQGDATEAFTYPALIADSSDKISALIKLAENGSRDALHPVDEFLSYQSAIDEGNSIKGVANANGVSQRYVKQRLKLAQLSSLLLDALRTDEIDLEAAAAYTLGETHDAQEQAYKALNHWQRNSAHQIKTFLTETKVPSNSPIAKLVGKTAYRKAGGAITSNLFGDIEYFEDRDLLHSLGREILEAEAQKLDGWKWVDIDITGSNSGVVDTGVLSAAGYDIPEELLDEEAKLEAEFEALDNKDDDEFTDADQERYEALEDRLYEIREKKEQFAVFDKDEMQFAGCIVGIDHNGCIEVSPGRIKPEDRKALGAHLAGAESPALDGDDEVHSTSAAPSDGYTQALASDLSSTRAALLQAAVAQHSDAAYDLGVFTLADALLREGMVGWTSKGSNINVTVDSLAGADGTALAAMDKVKQRLNLAWAKEGKPAKRFEAFCKLPSEEKASIFAFCVARGIAPHLYDTNHNPAAMLATIDRVKPNYRESWTPEKESFFKRISKPELVAIGTELFGEEWGTRNADAKKRDLVNVLSMAFNHEVNLSEDQRAKFDQWAPKGF